MWSEGRHGKCTGKWCGSFIRYMSIVPSVCGDRRNRPTATPPALSPKIVICNSNLVSIYISHLYKGVGK